MWDGTKDGRGASVWLRFYSGRVEGLASYEGTNSYGADIWQFQLCKGYTRYDCSPWQ
ncbi:hypothetical protein SAMN04488564_12719 [Lentzea waywayandensis]|uniref:Uncharacterized protein n=1 Tax=Lentzea waywayandensis TaxID=84724 RepID=A0A1I6FJF9_9PSEU|nr:hypothetical protein SAMN04488564_12719 [Lentzea waywayandensis]